MLAANVKSRLPRFPYLRVPIMKGPLRGYQWAVMSHGKVLRYLLGSYEREQAELYAASIRPGDVVLDVGANLGYFTLLFSHLVGPSGRVLAFEPSPTVAYFLELHVGRNRRANVTTYHAALGAESGMVRFDAETGTGRGAVNESGATKVSQLTLDSVVQEAGVAPNFVKIDVEGHGGSVVQGAAATLRMHRPKVHFSIHNASELAAVKSLNTDLDYKIRRDSVGDCFCEPPQMKHNGRNAGLRTFT
jgi:FkbM family methyltransferase